MKGDLSGHFEHVMVALVTAPALFDAKQLKKSMKVRAPDKLMLHDFTDIMTRELLRLSGLGCLFRLCSLRDGNYRELCAIQSPNVPGL